MMIVSRSDLSEKSYNEADGRTAVTSTVHRLIMLLCVVINNLFRTMIKNYLIWR